VKVTLTNDKPDSAAFLLYVGLFFNHISKVLGQHNIKSVCIPLSKSQVSFGQSRMTGA
jgi:hypothetical protein